MQFPQQIFSLLRVVSGNVIVVQIDGNGLVVYDATSGLPIGSMASTAFVDDQGNSIYGGIASYGGNFNGVVDAVMDGGFYRFKTAAAPSFDREGGMDADYTPGDATDAATLTVFSPEAPSSPSGAVMVRLQSFSPDGSTDFPRVTIGAETGDSDDVTIAVRANIMRWEEKVGGTVTVEDWKGFGGSGSNLQNGWSQGTPTAQFYRDPMGFVHLQGRLTGGTRVSGTVFADLPANYRPTRTQFISATTDVAPYTAPAVEIASNGNLTTYGLNPTGDIVLDGIIYATF